MGNSLSWRCVCICNSGICYFLFVADTAQNHVAPGDNSYIFYTLIVSSIDRARSLAEENYIRLFHGYDAVRYLCTMRMCSPCNQVAASMAVGPHTAGDRKL